MGKTYTVRQGDCLVNISHRERLDWQIVWDHPKNRELREKRKSPNILKPGDKLFIPEIELKEYSEPTEQRHRYKVKLAKVKFTLTLKNLGKPRANEKYVLKVDGQTDREGQTDKNGTFTEKIPAHTMAGTLILGENQDRYTLHFGGIDPIDEISGVKSRLFNLGFYYGAINDETDDDLNRAVAEFQRTAKLAGEGKLTDETRKKLAEVHGS